MVTLSDFRTDNPDFVATFVDRLDGYHRTMLRALGGHLGEEAKRAGIEVPDPRGFPRVDHILKGSLGNENSVQDALGAVVHELWSMGLVRYKDLRKYSVVNKTGEGRIIVEPGLTGLGEQVLDAILGE